ncbi:hypothetical protein QJS10_CPB13g01620 [Acorus calamus]|uniref:Uncharacterized protein n=1 Tax=Acorus calamus TaxID=4465 RepID=A0AAV9DGL0_ACOCL|nr:hypothetical protein QJS10_CPB13g01620 [Acorus calamus]
MLSQQPNEKPDEKVPQQSAFESRHIDLMVLFGDWGFDPIIDVSNPFTDSNKGSVHIWQGREDKLVPVEVQRYVAEKLSWIKYHEIPEGGHLFLFVNGWSDTIVKAMLFGEKETRVSGN